MMVAGTADAELEVVQHRLRLVDTGAPARTAPSAVPSQVSTAQSASAAPSPAAAAVAPVAAPAPVVVPEPAPAGDEITDTVVGVVPQLTGYPPELLELDLDLEADLGVDTVKQAEIFAAIREHFGVARDDSLKLRDFPTLTHVIGWIRDKTGAPTPTAAPAEAPAAALEPVAAAAPVVAPAGDEVTDTVVSSRSSPDTRPSCSSWILTWRPTWGWTPSSRPRSSRRSASILVSRGTTASSCATSPTLTHVIGWIRDKTGAPTPTAAPAEAPAAALEPVAAAAPVAVPAGRRGHRHRGGCRLAAHRIPARAARVGLDLEADLGVDTVKQAEIFATVREHFSVARDDSLKLRDFPTLTHVIGWIRDKTAASPAVPSATPSSTETRAAITSEVPRITTVTGDISATDRITRQVPVPALRPELAACVPTGVALGSGTRVAVMRDQGGVADALIGRLTRLGVDVLAMEPDDDIDTVLGDAVDGVYWLAALDDEGPWRTWTWPAGEKRSSAGYAISTPPCDACTSAARSWSPTSAGRIPRLRRGRSDLPTGRSGHRVRQGVPAASGPTPWSRPSTSHSAERPQHWPTC